MHARRQRQLLKIRNVRAHLVLIELGNTGRHAGQHVEHHRGVEIPSPKNHVPVRRQRFQHLLRQRLEPGMEHRVVLCDGDDLALVGGRLPQRSVRQGEADGAGRVAVQNIGVTSPCCASAPISRPLPSTAGKRATSVRCRLAVTNSLSRSWLRSRFIRWMRNESSAQVIW